MCERRGQVRLYGRFVVAKKAAPKKAAPKKAVPPKVKKAAQPKVKKAAPPKVKKAAPRVKKAAPPKVNSLVLAYQVALAGNQVSSSLRRKNTPIKDDIMLNGSDPFNFVKTGVAGTIGRVRGMADNVEPMVTLEYADALYEGGVPVGEGSQGEARSVTFGLTRFIVKKFNHLIYWQSEQVAYAMVYQRVSQKMREHMTAPIFAPYPYSLQTMVVRSSMEVGTLSKMYKKLTPGEGEALGMQFAFIIAQLHSNGIVHADLGMPNLMVAQKRGIIPHLFLIDFGLAAMTDSPVKLRLMDLKALLNSSYSVDTPRWDLYWAFPNRKSKETNRGFLREASIMSKLFRWEDNAIFAYRNLMRFKKR
jgi:tRNA A-37 threonylcarbamoyl transferase component Bud32